MEIFIMIIRSLLANDQGSATPGYILSPLQGFEMVPVRNDWFRQPPTKDYAASKSAGEKSANHLVVPSGNADSTVYDSRG